MAQKPLLVAHRGESYDAPENTLAAFNLAWDRGDCAIELDVRLSDDGQLAVIHNADTEFIAGEKLLVSETLYERLSRLDAGAFKSEKYRGERIPLLQEVFATVPKSGKVLVEIKCGVEILPALSKCVLESELGKEQVEIICFDVEVLAEAGAQLPGHRRLLLGSLKKDDPAKLEELLQLCGEHAFDGVDLRFEDGIAEPLAAEFKKHNLLVYCWTVNDIQSALEHAEAGVDAITSDRAAWISEQLPVV